MKLILMEIMLIWICGNFGVKLRVWKEKDRFFWLDVDIYMKWKLLWMGCMDYVIVYGWNREGENVFTLALK